MNDSEFRRLIEKYQRGQVSEKEQRLLDEWFEELAAKNSESWSSADKLTLKHKILQELAGGGEITLHDRLPDSASSIFWLRTLRIAASLLLIATFSYVVWQFTSQDEINEVAVVHTSAGNHIKKVVLMDGSVVWLKPNSTLVFPEIFNQSGRSITLHGEALFQVAADSLRPFVIQCGDLITTVLGTSFNIKSTEKDIEVVVLTGKVSLTSKNDTKGVIVLPNEKALYLVSQKQIAKLEQPVAESVAKAAIAGTEYRMRFEDTNMDEVIRRIEGKFNVTIYTRDRNLRNCMITADFTGQSLERTLDMISQAVGFNYEIEGGSVTLSGAGCPKKN